MPSRSNLDYEWNRGLPFCIKKVCRRAVREYLSEPCAPYPPWKSRVDSFSMPSYTKAGMYDQNEGSNNELQSRATKCPAGVAPKRACDRTSQSPSRRANPISCSLSHNWKDKAVNSLFGSLRGSATSPNQREASLAQRGKLNHGQRLDETARAYPFPQSSNVRERL